MNNLGILNLNKNYKLKLHPFCAKKDDVQKCIGCLKPAYKKPFHIPIIWTQWTGSTVSCAEPPAFGLMTGKNFKSPDCRLHLLPRPGRFQMFVRRAEEKQLFACSAVWSQQFHKHSAFLDSALQIACFSVASVELNQAFFFF